MIYTYDGSFFGYLSAVFDGWHDGVEQIEDICLEAEEASLFSESRFVTTDDGKARRILDGLLRQCGPKACHYFYYAFLSEPKKGGMILLGYLRKAFYYKGTFLNHRSDGMLYCRLKPTCCVIPVMAPHFIRRLPGERWVLHDTGRGFGVYYDREKPVMVTIPDVQAEPELSDDELAIERAWQNYYRTIAIPSRKNEALRRNFMPKKYWPTLIEMK